MYKRKRRELICIDREKVSAAWLLSSSEDLPAPSILGALLKKESKSPKTSSDTWTAP